METQTISSDDDNVIKVLGVVVASVEDFDPLTNTIAAELTNVEWKLPELKEYDGMDACLWLDGSLVIDGPGYDDTPIFETNIQGIPSFREKFLHNLPLEET